MSYEVTIGIPVYQVEPYIRCMLDSALAQTFPDIEFLVCDDCGTDGSMDIVREYQQAHPRGRDIRIVRQPRNMGLGCARNRIVDEAHGRYLYHLDADDTIAPNTIALLYENLKKYDAQIVYASHERIETYGDSAKHIPCRYPSLQFLQENAFAAYVYRKYDGIQAMTWNFLIDIDVYRKNNLHHLPINYWEDFTFTMLLPTYITRAVLLSDITYYYCCRSGSLSHFQQRDHIGKQEIQTVVSALEVVKRACRRSMDKPYFAKLYNKVMMTDLYVVCTILRNRRVVSPRFTNHEIREVMKSPLTFREVLSLKTWRWRNLALWLLSVLPSAVSVALVRVVGKMKGLV